MTEEGASAIGAINDLRRMGAVEGIHFRVSPPDEDITRYAIAFDRGPMVELIQLGEGSQFRTEPGFQGFAIVNPEGMAMVGCPVMAGRMRSGALPGEVAYLVKPDG